MSLGWCRRLARLERGLGFKPEPHLPPARLQRRLARLEAELTRLEAVAFAPSADDAAIMELIVAHTRGGLVLQIEEIRRALLTPRQRADKDEESRWLQRKYAAMADHELGAVINEQLTARARSIWAPIAPAGAADPSRSQ